MLLDRIHDDCRAQHEGEAVFYLVVPAADAELPAETVTGGTVVCTAAVLKQTQLYQISTLRLVVLL